MKTNQPVTHVLMRMLQPPAKARARAEARHIAQDLAKVKPAPDRQPGAGKQNDPQQWLNRVLFEAVSRGSIADVSDALDRGADVNARDRLRRTPLMHAAFDLDKQIEKLLRTKGANPLLRDADGRTARRMAEIARRLEGTEPSEGASETLVLPK